MEEKLDGKQWYKSKAVWAAVVTALVGAVQPISTALGHPIVVPEWVYAVLGGFGLYGVRDAVGKGSALKAFILAGLIGIMASSVHAYSWKQGILDARDDTKELYSKRMEVKANYYVDFLESGSAQSKVGASIPVLAWKFITIDPSFIYTADGSKKTGEYGVGLSIRLSRIPLGDGFTVGDMFDAECPEWLSRIHVGPYLAHNLQTGRFGLGVQSGVKF
jgi:hypothetical protein